MFELPTIPLEVLALTPLALAAGLDLYLTLFFLGAAPTLGWWDSLPGALGDLNSPGVLSMVGAFYLLELLTEFFPSAALFWHSFHTIIRPLAGVLLALLLLQGHPLSVVIPGAVVAGALASGAHATRTGGGVLFFWLDARKVPSRFLVALLEDSVVLALVVLALDAPGVGVGVAAAMALAGSRVLGSQVRAFAFAVGLVWARVWLTLGQPRWRDPDGIPAWVRDALEGDAMAPGGGLRGAPVGGHRLPGGPRFATGWVVVRGGAPLFVYWRRGATHTVDLGTLKALKVVEENFFRRVELGGAASCNLYFRLDGPRREALMAEFLVT